MRAGGWVAARPRTLSLRFFLEFAMDLSNVAPISGLARSPFRALHALVEFFAPWQKEDRQHAATRLAQPASPPRSQESPHALRVAHALRADTQAARRAAQLVVLPRSRDSAGAAATQVACRDTPRLAANQAHLAQPPRRPLRVTRAVEPRMPANASGRMVISGRMADVCAELERLPDAAQAHA